MEGTTYPSLVSRCSWCTIWRPLCLQTSAQMPQGKFIIFLFSIHVSTTCLAQHGTYGIPLDFLLLWRHLNHGFCRYNDVKWVPHTSDDWQVIYSNHQTANIYMMCVCVCACVRWCSMFFFKLSDLVHALCIYKSCFNDSSTSGHRKTLMTVTSWLVNHPSDRCIWAPFGTIRDLHKKFLPWARVQVQKANSKVIPVCLAMALMPIQTSALLKVRRHGNYQWGNRGFIPKILLWQHNIQLLTLNQLGSIQFNHFFNINIHTFKNLRTYISVLWSRYKHPVMPHATPYVLNTPLS